MFECLGYVSDCLCGGRSPDKAPESPILGDNALALDGLAPVPRTACKSAARPIPDATSYLLNKHAPSEIPPYIGKLKSGFQLLAKNAAPFVDGTPFKMPISALNACIDLANTVSDNNSAINKLFEQTSRRLDLVNAALIRAKSEDVKERVTKLAGILITETQSLHSMSNRGAWEKIVLSDEDTQTIIDVVTRVDGHLVDFQLDVIMAIERNVENAAQQLSALRIDTWPRSKHATYGADTDTATTLLKRQACTPNTQVSILGHIKQWVEDPSPDTPSVFWLSGPAGCGKSTIASSISQHYDIQSDVLAANFFCSRLFNDTSMRKYIIPTIACQLAQHSSSFRRALVAVNPFESLDEPDKHMEVLLARPWKMCPQIPSSLIIIDALDEIADGEGPILLQKLLGMLRDGHLSRLRFLVTSRAHPDIVALCASFPQHVCRVHELGMTNISDITLFLDDKLRALKGEPELAKLAQRSGGLWIYAATSVKYCTPRPRMAKAEQLHLLRKLLGPTWPVGRNKFLIDELYKQILWSAFSDLEDEQFEHRVLILHAILAGYEPTSTSIIVQLLPTVTTELVELVVGELHAVLNMKDGAIFWYHTSFPDFIFDTARSRFSVELPGQTRLIDVSCYEHVSNGLHIVKLERQSRGKSMHAVSGTCVESITQWVADASPDTPRVLWLTGSAGVGKSTIATSISHHYDTELHLLVADFFWSFGNAQGSDYIIPSLVYQLAGRSSSFHHALIAADQFDLPEEPTIQLKQLLVEPWGKCMRGHPIPSVLIILDGLDEITDGGVPTLLRAVLEFIHEGQLPGFKFLITSRPIPQIAAVLVGKSACRIVEVD
ncbi:hypothetical protein B0H13DRAFT_1946589 [Mycena leptocephala]|nr:hypothetical protein B0H13DRAFT_1946589 [Mycena leptocephala]